MKKRILLVDDEAGIRASLKVVLEPAYETFSASSAQEGLDQFRRESPHLVLLDVVMPGMDGLALLKMIREEDARVPVIMLTGTKTVKTAVEAMKLGAADYLSKPFDVEELRLIVAKTLETGELEQEVLHLRAQVAKRYSFHNLIGKSPAMQEIYSKIEPPGPAVYRHQLRRVAGRADRERTLRTRKGILHGCPGPAHRPVRTGPRRHVVSR